MRRGNISNTVKKELYTQSEVLEKLREFKSAHGEEYGIEVLGLFGSYSRNEQSEGSDIDVAVKLKEPSLLRFIGLEQNLQKSFKAKVHLVSLTAKFLPGFREEIEKDIIILNRE